MGLSESESKSGKNCDVVVCGWRFVSLVQLYRGGCAVENDDLAVAVSTAGWVVGQAGE